MTDLGLHMVAKRGPKAVQNRTKNRSKINAKNEAKKTPLQDRPGTVCGRSLAVLWPLLGSFLLILYWFLKLFVKIHVFSTIIVSRAILSPTWPILGRFWAPKTPHVGTPKRLQSDQKKQYENLTAFEAPKCEKKTLPSCERKAAQANIIHYFQKLMQRLSHMIRYFQTCFAYLFIVFVQQRDFHDIAVKPTKNMKIDSPGRSWGALGGTFGHSWGSLGRSWQLLGRSWAALGAILAALGLLLGRS